MFIVQKNILLLKSAIYGSSSATLKINKLLLKILKILYTEGLLLSFNIFNNRIKIYFLLDTIYQPLSKLK